MDDWDKELEFKYRTIDALILGFEKPIRYDLYIPDLEIVLGSFKYSMDKLFENKNPTISKYANIGKKDFPFGREKDFFKQPALKSIFKPIKEMRKNIKDALIDVLGKVPGSDYGGTYWQDAYIEIVFKRFERYEEVIFPKLGSLYKFKEERGKVEQEVKKHFSEAEMKNFHRLHKHMRVYVKKHYQP